MELSCVIVTKNRPQSLQRLLDSLSRQTVAPFEVIIVNDGGNPLNLENRGLPLVLLESAKSHGSGRARNKGVGHSRGTIVLILDDDVELDSADFLAKGLEPFEDSQLALVFPRKIDDDGKNQRDISYYHETKLTGEFRGMPQEKWTEAFQCSPLLGSMVVFIRKSVFTAVGGYDFIFGWGRGHSFREETDFQLRVQERGWKVLAVPKIVFRHHLQKAGGHGRNQFKNVFWIGHNQVVFGIRHIKNWIPKSLFFAGLELPRYAWGNGRLITYPAGLVGMGAGLASSLYDHIIRSKSRPP